MTRAQFYTFQIAIRTASLIMDAMATDDPLPVRLVRANIHAEDGLAAARFIDLGFPPVLVKYLRLRRARHADPRRGRVGRGYGCGLGALIPAPPPSLAESSLTRASTVRPTTSSPYRIVVAVSATANTSTAMA